MSESKYLSGGRWIWDGEQERVQVYITIPKEETMPSDESPVVLKVLGRKPLYLPREVLRLLHRRAHRDAPIAPKR